MDTSSNAFTLTTDISEEILIDLTTAVDALDTIRMVIGATVAEPEEDRDLADYIERATLYLEFLRKTIEDGDILAISTMPISESATRRRISEVLRASGEEAGMSLSDRSHVPDLSGAVPLDTLETLAYNVDDLLELDARATGHPAPRRYPVGQMDYIQIVIRFLAQLRRQMREEIERNTTVGCMGHP